MHFVFIVDSYDRAPSANGVCVKNVIDSLIDDGQKVTIIIQRKDPREKEHEELGNLTIYRVYYGAEFKNQNKKAFSIFHRIFSRIRFFLNIAAFPITNVSYANRIVKKCEQINKKNKIDAIVAVTQIVDHIKSGISFKQKHPLCKVIVYSLDAMTSGYVSTLKRGKRFFQSRMEKYEKKTLAKCDWFIAMEPHKKFILSHPKLYQESESKILYADIPLFLPREETDLTTVPEDKLIVYTGNMSYLETDHVERLLDALPDYNFLFVGPRGDHLKSLLPNHPNLSLLESVGHEKVLKIQAKASFLLAFNSDSSSMIPGKILEYFSSKKTVIFYSKTSMCSFMEYLERYNNYCFITPDMSPTVIRQALSSPKTCRESIEGLFLKNQPQYTAKLLISAMETVQQKGK